MALGKQAKIISDRQVRAVLAELDARRYPLRDRVMFLLSLKAGMRAVEISRCTWAMVTDAEGKIGEVIALQNRASKGKGGGRIIPMHPDLRRQATSRLAGHPQRARSGFVGGRGRRVVPSPLYRTRDGRLLLA